MASRVELLTRLSKEVHRHGFSRDTAHRAFAIIDAHGVLGWNEAVAALGIAIKCEEYRPVRIVRTLSNAYQIRLATIVTIEASILRSIDFNSCNKTVATCVNDYSPLLNDYEYSLAMAAIDLVVFSTPTFDPYDLARAAVRAVIPAGDPRLDKVGEASRAGADAVKRMAAAPLTPTWHSQTLLQKLVKRKLRAPCEFRFLHRHTPGALVWLNSECPGKV